MLMFNAGLYESHLFTPGHQRRADGYKLCDQRNTSSRLLLRFVLSSLKCITEHWHKWKCNSSLVCLFLLIQHTSALQKKTQSGGHFIQQLTCMFVSVSKSYLAPTGWWWWWWNALHNSTGKHESSGPLRRLWSLTTHTSFTTCCFTAYTSSRSGW